MAAWSAMKVTRGLLAAVSVVVLATGCRTLIDGRAECGMLSVPVDYGKPDGEVARIAVMRIRATGQKIGSLVVNPGGPGKSGNEAAAALVTALPAAVREKFDLVGFDPRGVAGSRPEVWCNSDDDNDRLRAEPQVDYSEAGVNDIEQDTRDFVRRCTDKMGDEYLANVGTVNVARDLDAIRQALGDEKHTVDYAADCAENPGCPLGSDPTKAVEVYKSLVDPLVKTPAKTSDPRGLSYNDAIVGTILPLYSPTLWQHLSTALLELRAGRGDTMLRLADVYMGRDAQGHYDNSTDVRVAVNCVDKPPITDRSKVVEQDKRARDAAPFMSYGDFTGNAPLGTCAFWPVPPSSEPHELKVQGLPPTLVVSTTNDPATPYQAGVELAAQLGGALLTYQGTQHTVVFQGDACVDDYSTKYLGDVTTPPKGATC